MIKIFFHNGNQKYRFLIIIMLKKYKKLKIEKADMLSEEDDYYIFIFYLIKSIRFHYFIIINYVISIYIQYFTFTT